MLSFSQALMIVHVGFQTFEFRLGPVDLEDQETLYFPSREDALKWLKRMGFLHSNLIVRLRSYVARYCDDPETFRVTQHYSLERLANLLYLRRIIVTYVEERAVAGSPTPVTAAPAPAFPLSERSQRDASTSSQPPPDTDAAMFDPDVDAAVQAAALVAAAADGKPFCPE